jgi:hypothetical protein
MASKVWVLDTETKGTGAQMVPLESVLEKPRPRPEPLVPPRRPRPKPERAAAPPAPRRFRVVDIATREVLADDAGARRTLEVLGGARSVVDVNVHVWEPDDERWRLLTLREKRLLWERRG